jgi:FkbM family methyltransferase
MDIIRKALAEPKLQSDLEVLKIIKDSELPIVLWGAAKLAKFIIRILEKNDIKINAVFIDKPNQNQFLGDIKVVSFDEICSRFNKFNILIAHGEHELSSIYKGHSQVENILTIFDFPSHGFSYNDNFLIHNSSIFNELFHSLSDKLSKDSFEAYVTSRASNNWRLIHPFIVGNQYFMDAIDLTKNEIVVDCGAYTGDTLMDFIRISNGNFEKYYALEPSPNNAKILEEIVVQNKFSNIQIVRKAAWDKQEYFSFEEDTDTSHMNLNNSSDNNILVETDLIDNIVLSKASFIKMDIEGAELMALKGAANTIRSNKPKLAIAIYHKTEDLITIPAFIKELRPDYKFYFRLHTKLGSDAVIYAI